MPENLQAQGLVYELYYKRYRQSFRMGSYSGFVRGFCAKDIAPYLVDKSQLAKATFERLSRTRMMIKDAIYYGMDAPQVRQHFVHINRAHEHISLTDEHYLYVLANFVIDPLRILRMHTKQRLNEDELQAFLLFWQRIAEAMKLNGIPNSLTQWIRFRNAYERKHEAYSSEQQDLLMTCLNEVPKLSLPVMMRKPFLSALPWLIPLRMRRAFSLREKRSGLFVLSLLRIVR